MLIRASEDHIPQINKLLYQVHSVHSDRRPDLFRPGMKKYNDDELRAIINNPNTPIYLYENASGAIIAHAFIKYEYLIKKEMYIDDICVDISYRHQGICTKILNSLELIAKKNGCYRMTLNVYMLNKEAIECYHKFGMQAYSMHMEKLI